MRNDLRFSKSSKTKKKMVENVKMKGNCNIDEIDFKYLMLTTAIVT